MSGYWELGKSSPELMIAIPSITPVSIDWCFNFMSLARPGSTVLRTWKGLPVDVARDTLVRDALKLGAKHILWLDSDNFPEPDTYHVLRYQHLPIVGVLYYSKRGDYACWNLTPDGKFLQPFPKGSVGSGPMRVDAMGFGCVLTDTRVFQVLKEPWFKWDIRNPTVKTPGIFSEDVFFCLKAWREGGFPSYVLSNLRCGHEQTVVKDPEGEEIKEKEVY